MRTTIQIDDHLFSEAKQLAARTDRTLTQVFENALRLYLSTQQGTQGRPRVRLKTFRGQGLQPGVDLDDSASLGWQSEGLESRLQAGLESRL